MQIYIGSDIHGSEANVRRFLDVATHADKDAKIVLLGDIYNHGPRNPFPEGYAPMKVAEQLNAVHDRLTVVKGNCDSEVDEMISEFSFLPEYRLPFYGRTLFFTHGHKCNADMPHKDAAPGDIVFYGHFHRPSIRIVDDVAYVCVGALGMSPEGVSRSYAVLNEESIFICDLDDGAILNYCLL